MNIATAKKVMLAHLDMREDKIRYIIIQPSLVAGLWGCLAHYGIEHTKDNHELLVEIVQEKLEGPDLEREWSEREYETFVKMGGV